MTRPHPGNRVFCGQWQTIPLDQSWLKMLKLYNFQHQHFPCLVCSPQLCSKPSSAWGICQRSPRKGSQLGITSFWPASKKSKIKVLQQVEKSLKFWSNIRSFPSNYFDCQLVSNSNNNKKKNVQDLVSIWYCHFLLILDGFLICNILDSTILTRGVYILGRESWEYQKYFI